jgi:hypothetical protein
MMVVLRKNQRGIFHDRVNPLSQDHRLDEQNQVKS